MTPPLRPLPPAVRKAFAEYQKRPLDRLSDLAGLSRATGDAVQSFAMGATEPLDVKGALRAARRGIEAWHGSPHKFDKFSLEKIGTGEGAQAYGHGLYFAENKDVAGSYRNSGGTRSGDPKGYASDIVGMFKGDRNKALAHIRQIMPADGLQTFSGETAPFLIQVENAIRSGDLTPGSLYRVRLDVSPDELLDWDKPLAQQPEKVRKVAQEFGMDATDHGYDELVKEAEAQAKDAFMRWKADPTDDKYREFLRADDDQRKIWNSRASSKSGKDVYQEIGVRGDAEASRRLRERGIPGIRYLDGGSRAAGDGTRNYVIFDPERIQILERLAALGLGGQMVKDMLAKAKAASASQQSQPPTLPPVTVRPPSTPRS